MRKAVLLSIQKMPIKGESREPEKGLCHPPKNPVTATTLTTNMLAYSLKKKKAYLIPEYSVTKPATNSDSDSGKSNGVLLVSASALIK